MSGTTPAIGFGLMCKPPRPGTSKTRLAADIGAAAAAALSAAFLADCAAAVTAAGQLSPLDRAAFYRPHDAAAEIGALLGPGWALAHADAGDLGATMLAILGRLLINTPAGAMIMGADIPLIRPEDIDQAAAALRAGSDKSVVIAPSADGGYCLIGIKSAAAAAPLFTDMHWSTAGVFDETLRRAQAADLEVTVLATQRDIDEAADLDWLRAELDRHPQRAPATRRVLATLG